MQTERESGVRDSNLYFDFGPTVYEGIFSKNCPIVIYNVCRYFNDRIIHELGYDISFLVSVECQHCLKQNWYFHTWQEMSQYELNLGYTSHFSEGKGRKAPAIC